MILVVCVLNYIIDLSDIACMCNVLACSISLDCHFLQSNDDDANTVEIYHHPFIHALLNGNSVHAFLDT